jgi:adenylate cyclase class 2
MNYEIEAKFLNIDIEEIRTKLTQAGGSCLKPMRLMRRAMFDYPDGRFQKSVKNKEQFSERLRVRDEGDKVTITYKKSNRTNYAHELETTVGDYEAMIELLLALDFKVFSYQESRRETWQLGQAEVVIDEWPWVPSYIEIEAESEELVKDAAARLGLGWADAKFGSVDTAYREKYKKMKPGESVGELAEVCFDAPLPQFFIDRQ